MRKLAWLIAAAALACTVAACGGQAPQEKAAPQDGPAVQELAVDEAITAVEGA